MKLKTKKLEHGTGLKNSRKSKNKEHERAAGLRSMNNFTIEERGQRTGTRTRTRLKNKSEEQDYVIQVISVGCD